MARLLEDDKSKPNLVLQIANIINTLRAMQVITSCLYFDGESGIDPEELEQQLQLKKYIRSLKYTSAKLKYIIA